MTTETRKHIETLRAERRSTSNKISGARTQLKRPSTIARAHELEAYLDRLLRRRDDLPLEIRIAELEAPYEETVAAIAAPCGLFKAETASRNAKAGRRRNRGLPPLETVTSELRRDAERTVARILADRRDDPTVDRMARQLEEADQLRAELAARQEARNPWLTEEAA